MKRLNILHTLSSLRICNNDHYSDTCKIVAELEARKQAIRRQRRCFKCLKYDHIARNCQVKIKCYSCGKQNVHHTFLCPGIEKNVNINNKESSTNLVSGRETVLLQTAQCEAISGNNSKAIGIKCLFNSCSQQTYVTEKLVKNLGLKPLRHFSMVVKAFGENDGKPVNVSEYELNLRSCSGKIIKIKAVAVPTICVPVGSGHQWASHKNSN